MSTPPAIEASGLSKRFTRNAARPTTLKEAFVRLGQRRSVQDVVWALRDLSFQVAPGEMLGVIGANGAGKSTLLRLVGGVLAPDAGTVAVRGRIGGLLSLGTGFHDDLTGRENIFTNGVVAGLTRREVARRLDAIVDFAELAHAIDAPLRTYSTGMRLRLGFAVAVHTDPDVLLIDEALSVGDLAFQQKCLARIHAFRDDGCALLFVSHSPGQVRQACDRVLWLDGGEAAALGPADVVVGDYEAAMQAETIRRTPDTAPVHATGAGTQLRLHETRFGSQEATLTDVRFYDNTGTPVETVCAGQPLAVEVAYDAPQPIGTPIVSLTLASPDGTACLDVNTEAEAVPLPALHGRGTLTCHIDRLDAAPGRYFVNAGLYAAGWAYAYDYHWQVHTLTVVGGQPASSAWSPPRRWALASASAETAPSSGGVLSAEEATPA
jgi:lipopolysaccharide transport system ATP-binding protein